jgi:hypothetical protein
MRGRPRATTHPCARGNASQDRRGSHYGRSQWWWSRVTRSRKSDLGDGATSGGQGSRVGGRVHLGVLILPAQDSGQRQAQPPRPAPTVAPARAGLRLRIHVHRPHGSGSPCVQLLYGADKGAQGTAIPPEREPSVSPAEGRNEGCRRQLHWRDSYYRLLEFAERARANAGGGGASASGAGVGRLGCWTVLAGRPRSMVRFTASAISVLACSMLLVLDCKHV